MHPNLQSGFIVCFQDSAGFFYFFFFSFLEETPLRPRRFGSPAGSELRCIIRGPTCRQTRITAVRGPPCACLTQQRVPQEEFWRRARLICILAAPFGFFFFPPFSSFLSFRLSFGGFRGKQLLNGHGSSETRHWEAQRGLVARAFWHLCAHTHMHGHAQQTCGVCQAR